MNEPYNLYACTQCRQTRLENSAAALVCAGCGTRYDLIFGNVPDFAPAPERRDSAAHSYTYSYSSRFYEWGRKSLMMQLSTGLSWKHEIKLLLDALNISGNENILDVGCGTGIVAREIAKRFTNTKINGLDYSYSQLRQAVALQKKYRINNIEFAHGLATKLPYADGAFHRVLTVGSMQFYGDIQVFFNESARVLQPGGRLVALNYLSPEYKKGETALIRRVQQTAVRHKDHFFEKDELHALANCDGLNVVEYIEKGIVFILTAEREGKTR